MSYPDSALTLGQRQEDRSMKRCFNGCGFTLIELMVVIAIIGVLAATATLAMTGYIRQARIIKATAEIEMILKALILLETDTNQWPGHQETGRVHIADENELWDLNDPSAGLAATDGGFPHWNGPYLPSVPRDPWGNNYFFDTDYNVNGQERVALGSFGPNGVGPNVYDDDDVLKIIR